MNLTDRLETERITEMTKFTQAQLNREMRILRAVGLDLEGLLDVQVAARRANDQLGMAAVAKLIVEHQLSKISRNNGK